MYSFRQTKKSHAIKNSNNITIHIGQNTRFAESACVCIMLHNVEQSMPSIVENINIFRNLFKRIFFVLIDNNSTDNTFQLCKNIPNSILLQSTGEEEYATRNMYLKFVYSNKTLFNYMIVIDADIALRNPLTMTSFKFLEAEMVDHWDVIFANQSYKYYDIQNLITPNFNIQDVSLDQVEKVIQNEQTHIPSDAGLIPVKSAYGGFAIYKTHILDINNKYTTDKHVSFNLRLHNKLPNIKMFIDSSFVIETHSDNAYLYR